MKPGTIESLIATYAGRNADEWRGHPAGAVVIDGVGFTDDDGVLLGWSLLAELSGERRAKAETMPLREFPAEGPRLHYVTMKPVRELRAAFKWADEGESP